MGVVVAVLVSRVAPLVGASCKQRRLSGSAGWRVGTIVGDSHGGREREREGLGSVSGFFALGCITNLNLRLRFLISRFALKRPVVLRYWVTPWGMRSKWLGYSRGLRSVLTRVLFKSHAPECQRPVLSRVIAPLTHLRRQPPTAAVTALPLTHRPCVNAGHTSSKSRPPRRCISSDAASCARRVMRA